VKWKCGFEQEFVIGGYTRGSSGQAFGALIVGYYESGKLRYASKVGTGFSAALVRQIIEAGDLIRQDASPFAHIPRSDGSSWSYGLTATERRSAVWLEPMLVCRVRFTEWTRDGHLRHPVLEGLRSDNDARDVVREATHR
jgi:bifunctional non-homologous end joining protein LigD